MKPGKTPLTVTRVWGNASLAISPAVCASEHDGGLVLLHAGRGKGSIFKANRIGARIWQGIVKGQSPEAIAARLSIEYGVPRAVVERDTAAFVADLIRHGILVYRQAQEAA